MGWENDDESRDDYDGGCVVDSNITNVRMYTDTDDIDYNSDCIGVMKIMRITVMMTNMGLCCL